MVRRPSEQPRTADGVAEPGERVREDAERGAGPTASTSSSDKRKETKHKDKDYSYNYPDEDMGRRRWTEIEGFIFFLHVRTFAINVCILKKW